ncbi:MAG: ATP-dependent helicase, partial [Crenarchaeota archaeon]|nr:ATP-dependent helicase [Thermoproteota archaeon]
MAIEYAREFSDDEVASYLHDLVRTWFFSRYGEFTPPQRMAIPYIKRGSHVLISSPTGTGKTLAAFLAIIDELVRLDLRSSLDDRVYAIYVSPLRALSNDMRKNLVAPLSEMSELSEKLYGKPLGIRVGVRTSDTLPQEKARMLREPPHILITTPESLSIAIVAPRFRELLKGVKWVVIDEIHELASSKRGAHLSLTLERLVDLAGGEFQRIGLSATIAPLEEVARFLGGYLDDGTPRKVVVVDARFSKPIDVKVVCPRMDLVYAPASAINEAIYEELKKLILSHRTTLVFTNTRSATERVVFKLKKVLGESGVINADEIEAHHGSLSRDVRLSVEDRLKQGRLRVVVSSTSLELGIDIGYIDLVVLLSSPKSVTRLLQRVGRSGHHFRAVSKGRVIVVDRDDLVECTVLAKLAMERKIDRVKIPRNCLDVLAQHIVGMSLEKPRTIDEVYRIVRRSYTFHDLPRERLESVVRYLAGMYPGLEDFNVYAKIRYDPETGLIRRRRGARMIYMLNVGTIPDEAKIPVLCSDGGRQRYVGDLEEGFVEILSPGDIFVLGGRTYRVLAIHPTKVIVAPAEGERPTVPTWFSEMLPLAYDSALEVGRFRRVVAELIDALPPSEVIEWIAREYDLEEHAARYIYEYIYEQKAFMDGLVPSDRLIVVEVWRDESRGTTNIVFHSLFGRRVNDVLSRAYAYVLSEMVGRHVRIAVTDNGFMLTLPPGTEVDEASVRRLVESVTPDNLEELARRAIRRTELIKKRFRHCAERSFMLLRRYRGVDVSLARRQFNAEKLLRVVEQLGDFPVLEETYREILEDHMDLEHAREVLERVRRGEIEVRIFFSGSIP